MHLDLLAKISGPGYLEAVAEFDADLHRPPRKVTAQDREQAQLKRHLGVA